jgi:hypothetical protein
MYLMGESNVGIRCKKADKDKVEKAAKDAAAEYKENMSSDITTKVDESNWLPEESYVPPITLAPHPPTTPSIVV